MAKLSSYAAATTVNTYDTLPIIQGGVNKVATIAQIQASSTYPLGTVMKGLDTYSGATASDRFRTAVNNYPTSGVREIVVVPSGTTLDSGANNPFDLPNYFYMMCLPGLTDEFGTNGVIYTRHTGSSTTLGVFRMKSGPTKGQKFEGISFQGTSSTRLFVDTALDASDNAYWQYVQFFNVSCSQFESVAQFTGTGVLWFGVAFFNNFAASRPVFNFSGSDHQMFMGGGFFEMGIVASYTTRAALVGMIRMQNTNAVLGHLYITGSPTTPIRLDGGVCGIQILGMVLEGRPSPGTVGGDAPTDGLHCAGPLMRITGGRATIMVTHHGYAMRDPFSSHLGYAPGGFYHIEGGAKVAIIGGTFQPYAASNYPAYTLPDGVTAQPVDTQPPFAWVSGSGTRASFTGILWGSNVTTDPKVYTYNGGVAKTGDDCVVITAL